MPTRPPCVGVLTPTQALCQARGHPSAPRSAMPAQFLCAPLSANQAMDPGSPTARRACVASRRQTLHRDQEKLLPFCASQPCTMREAITGPSVWLILRL